MPKLLVFHGQRADKISRDVSGLFSELGNIGCLAPCMWEQWLQQLEVPPVEDRAQGKEGSLCRPVWGGVRPERTLNLKR